MSRSGVLVAWGNAFVAGRVGLDAALDAITGRDAPHRVLDIATKPLDALDAVTDDGPLSPVLIEWRRAGSRLRVVLPVPGDVRGLIGPPEFRRRATDAGEAVLGGGVGLTPLVVDYAPSSAPSTVTWCRAPVDPAAPPDDQSVPDAQFELATAMRECASALTAAGVAGTSTGPVAVDDARRAGEYVNLPPGHPARAVALLAQAQRLQAVLDLALADVLGGAVDRFGLSAREGALRPLTGAVRRARSAAYNAVPA